ncbi:hypothetical protein Droror1_Dr00025300 [Drosera rotundifolia]
MRSGGLAWLCCGGTATEAGEQRRGVVVLLQRRGDGGGGAVTWRGCVALRLCECAPAARRLRWVSGDVEVVQWLGGGDGGSDAAAQ